MTASASSVVGVAALSKSFGAIAALKNVSLDLAAGEVLDRQPQVLDRRVQELLVAVLRLLAQAGSPARRTIPSPSSISTAPPSS